MNSQCDEVERILWKSRRKEREANAERTKRSLDVNEVPLPEALPAQQTGKDTEKVRIVIPENGIQRQVL